MRSSYLCTLLSVTVTSQIEARTRQYYESTSNTIVTYKENINILKNFVWQSPENRFIIPSGLPGKNARSDLENSIPQTASQECTEPKYRIEWTVTGIATSSTGQHTWYFVSCFLASVGNLIPFWRSVSIGTTPLTLNTIWFCVLSHENARKKHPVNSFYIFKQIATVLHFTTCCIISVLFFHKMLICFILPFYVRIIRQIPTPVG